MEYREELDEIMHLVQGTRAREQAASAVVDYLHDHFDHYSWVDIYWVRGRDLILGPWKGPQATEHTRIPIGTGVCGAAAASASTEVVEDVSKDPRYLACFSSTQSEIVVPIMADGRVLGEIDIDSDRLAAFKPEDRRFLEQVALLLSQIHDA